MPDIKIYRENVYCKIVGLSRKEASKLSGVLSYRLNGYEFSPAYRSGTWDGRNKLMRCAGEQCRFPSGLLNKVLGWLEAVNLPASIVDKRPIVELGQPIEIKNLESRWYQEEAVQKATASDCGIIKIPTGGGKTAVMAMLLAHYNIPTMVFVPGVDLLYQTKEDLEHFLPDVEIGMIGDGEVDLKAINVCTFWTCAKALGQKYQKFGEEDTTKKEKFNEQNKKAIKRAIEKAQLMVVDECQFLGTKTMQTINAASVSARFRFGLSATAYREDGADLLLEGAVGQEIIKITPSQLIEDGFLVPPYIKVYSVPEKFDVGGTYLQVYKDYVVENEERNQIIIDVVDKLVKAGGKVLVLVKQIDHGKKIVDEIGKKHVVYFVRGELTSQERLEIRQGFEANEFQVLVASSVYDQGINIPSLNALVLACGGKSMGKLYQRIGRVIRTKKGKTKAYVIDFADNAKYLKKHSMIRVNIYNSEPSFKVSLPKNLFKPVKIRKDEEW